MSFVTSANADTWLNFSDIDALLCQELSVLQPEPEGQALICRVADKGAEFDPAETKALISQALLYHFRSLLPESLMDDTLSLSKDRLFQVVDEAERSWSANAESIGEALDKTSPMIVLLSNDWFLDYGERHFYRNRLEPGVLRALRAQDPATARLATHRVVAQVWKGSDEYRNSLTLGQIRQLCLKELQEVAKAPELKNQLQCRNEEFLATRVGDFLGSLDNVYLALTCLRRLVCSLRCHALFCRDAENGLPDMERLQTALAMALCYMPGEQRYQLLIRLQKPQHPIWMLFIALLKQMDDPGFTEGENRKETRRDPFIQSLYNDLSQAKDVVLTLLEMVMTPKQINAFLRRVAPGRMEEAVLNVKRIFGCVSETSSTTLAHGKALRALIRLEEQIIKAYLQKEASPLDPSYGDGRSVFLYNLQDYVNNLVVLGCSLGIGHSTVDQLTAQVRWVEERLGFVPGKGVAFGFAPFQPWMHQFLPVGGQIDLDNPASFLDAPRPLYRYQNSLKGEENKAYSINQFLESLNKWRGGEEGILWQEVIIASDFLNMGPEGYDLYVNGKVFEPSKDLRDTLDHLRSCAGSVEPEMLSGLAYLVGVKMRQALMTFVPALRSLSGDRLAVLQPPQNRAHGKPTSMTVWSDFQGLQVNVSYACEFVPVLFNQRVSQYLDQRQVQGQVRIEGGFRITLNKANQDKPFQVSTTINPSVSIDLSVSSVAWINASASVDAPCTDV